MAKPGKHRKTYEVGVWDPAEIWELVPLQLDQSSEQSLLCNTCVRMNQNISLHPTVLWALLSEDGALAPSIPRWGQHHRPLPRAPRLACQLSWRNTSTALLAAARDQSSCWWGGSTNWGLPPPPCCPRWSISESYLKKRAFWDWAVKLFQLLFFELSREPALILYQYQLSCHMTKPVRCKKHWWLTSSWMFWLSFREHLSPDASKWWDLPAFCLSAISATASKYPFPPTGFTPDPGPLMAVWCQYTQHSLPSQVCLQAQHWESVTGHRLWPPPHHATPLVMGPFTSGETLIFSHTFHFPKCSLWQKTKCCLYSGQWLAGILINIHGKSWVFSIENHCIRRFYVKYIREKGHNRKLVLTFPERGLGWYHDKTAMQGDPPPSCYEDNDFSVGDCKHGTTAKFYIKLNNDK